MTRVVDTLILGQYVKNAILVVRPDMTLKEAVVKGIQEMQQARIKIVGIVVNAAEIQKSYHYRYRYVRNCIKSNKIKKGYPLYKNS